jgi:uncharacterized phiE125 gp8 family phage protein
VFVQGHLQIITAPAIEPVTVDEVKMHTHIGHNAEDDLIAMWIKSGRELAEGFQRRAFITQTIELTLDRFPECGEIFLPRSPLASVTSFTYYDHVDAATAWALTNLIVDASSQPGRLALGYGIFWPSVTLRSINAIKIRYTAGYGSVATDVPGNVRDAITLYCSFRNESRAGESGAIPEQFFDLLRHDRMFL